MNSKKISIILCILVVFSYCSSQEQISVPQSDIEDIEDIENIENEFIQIVDGITIRTTEKIDESKYDFVEKYQMEEGTQKTFTAPNGYKVAKAIAYVDKWPPEEKCSMDISVPISMYSLGLSEFTINADPTLVGDPCPGPKTWYFTFGYVKEDVEINVLEQINVKEPKLYEIRQFLQDRMDSRDVEVIDSSTSLPEICNDQDTFSYDFNNNLIESSGLHEAALWNKNLDNPEEPTALSSSDLKFEDGNLDLENRLSYLTLPDYLTSCLARQDNIEISLRIKIPAYEDAIRPLITNTLFEACGQIELGVCLFLTPPDEVDNPDYYLLGFYSGQNENFIAGFKFFATQTPIYAGKWYDIKLKLELNAVTPAVSIVVDDVVNKFTSFPEWDGDPKIAHEYLFSNESRYSLFGIRNEFNEWETDTNVPLLVDKVTIQNFSKIQESEEINSLLTQLITNIENNSTQNNKSHYQRITSLFVGDWDPVSSNVLDYLSAVEKYEGSIYPPTVKTNIKTLSYTKQLAHFFKEWIFDNLFIEDQIKKVENLSFKETEIFPGSVASNPQTISRTIEVNGTYNESPGYHFNNDETVLRPTGLYAEPGKIVTIEVPKEVLDKGWLVQVGIHGGNLACWSETRRFNRIANTFELNKETVSIANPFGGGIYIIVPDGSDSGIIEISIKDAINMPTFSTLQLKGINNDLDQFKSDLKTSQVPWFEIISDKFNLTYPLEYSNSYENPLEMLGVMEKSLDAIMLMSGRPLERVRAEWLVVDAQIIACGTAMAASYPTFGDYDGSPSLKDKVNDGLWFSPYKNDLIYWHEMGHLHNLPTLGCQEQESNVHLLKAVIDSKVFNSPPDIALKNSGFQPFTRLEAAFDLMFTIDWQNEERVCGENDYIYGGNQMRYQTKSWARYLEIVDLYGWETVGKIHNAFYNKNIRIGYIKDYEISDDEFVYRASHEVGINLAPIFEFWGLVLDHNIINGLKVLPPPIEFIERLNFYKDNIPNNEKEYNVMLDTLRSGVGDDQYVRIDYWKNNYSQSILDKMHDRIDKIIKDINNY